MKNLPKRSLMNKKKTKLIFLWTYIQWGGAQIYFLAIMKQALAEWDIEVILPRNSKQDILKFLDEIGVSYKFIETTTFTAPAETLSQKLNRQLHRIQTEIKTYNYFRGFPLRKSILHLDAAPWQSWILLSLLAARGNVFVTMHNALPPVSKWRKRVWSFRLNYLLKLKNFHLFVANQNTKDELRELVSADLMDKIILTRAAINPVEIEEIFKKEIDRAGLCARFGIPADKFIVLCVGQFIDRKGRWIFLEAAKQILQNHTDTVFVWLMPELPNEEDRKKIENYNLAESFIPVKSADVGTSREKVLQFFRIADVFVLPSLVEGLPIALMEAMALEIPCISTEIYAIPEAVKHLETGVLIEPGNSKPLVEAILELKNDSKLREKLTKQGRTFILENFDERYWSQIALENYRLALKNQN